MIPTANKNVEALETALDHELATKFSKDFMELFSSKEKVKFKGDKIWLDWKR